MDCQWGCSSQIFKLKANFVCTQMYLDGKINVFSCFISVSYGRNADRRSFFVLLFIYTNKFSTANVMPSFAKDLLLAATTYMIDDVETLCVDQLARSFDKANIASILAFAEANNLVSLKRRCIDFAMSCHPDILYELAYPAPLFKDVDGDVLSYARGGIMTWAQRNYRNGILIGVLLGILCFN
jgi:hypothetical protein